MVDKCNIYKCRLSILGTLNAFSGYQLTIQDFQLAETDRLFIGSRTILDGLNTLAERYYDPFKMVLLDKPNHYLICRLVVLLGLVDWCHWLHALVQWYNPVFQARKSGSNPSWYTKSFAVLRQRRSFATGRASRTNLGLITLRL